VADILISNARRPDRGYALADIAISDGVIGRIGPRLEVDAGVTVDAGKNLVTPVYVNPHLHLSKVWTLPMMSEAALAAYHGADILP
jgi:cytosine deaminase